MAIAVRLFVLKNRCLSELHQICNIELKPGEDVGEGVGGVGGVPAAPQVDHLESGSLPWQNPNIERN